MNHVPDYIIFNIELGDEKIPITVEAFVKASKVARHVTVTVAGYDNDPRDLWDIPEVTNFLRNFAIKSKALGANFSCLDQVSKALLLHACGKADVIRNDKGGATFHILGDL